MRVRQFGWVLTAAMAMAGCNGRVANAASPDPASVQAPIHGVTVMGDKGRSGPDGWVQAPVTRDQAPVGKAPGETEAAVHSAPDSQASGDAGKSLPPGQDPGTPAVAAAQGPGSIDAASSPRKP